MRIRTTDKDEHFADDDASLFLCRQPQPPESITTTLFDAPPPPRLAATTRTYELPFITLLHAARTPQYKVSELPTPAPNTPLEQPTCVALYQYSDPSEPLDHQKHILAVGTLSPALFFTIPSSVAEHLLKSPPDCLLCFGHSLRLLRKDFLEKSLLRQRRSIYLDFLKNRLRSTPPRPRKSVTVYLDDVPDSKAITFPFPLPDC